MSKPISAASTVPRDRKSCEARTKRVRTNSPRSILCGSDRYNSTDREIKAGCDLFRMGESGDAIYSLVDGWVVLYNLLEDGRRQILQFALPGNILAFAPTRGAAMNYSAQALTDSLVCVVPHERLEQLSRDWPEIGMQLAGQISQARSLAYDHLSSLGRRSARERVAHLLLELFMRSRLRWPGHRTEEMHLPMTQEHIGDATGLTGVHVNRVLRDLCAEGILEFHYRRLRIMNPDRLVDVAGIDPQVALAWIDHESATEATAGYQESTLAPVIWPSRDPQQGPPLRQTAM